MSASASASDEFTTSQKQVVDFIASVAETYNPQDDLKDWCRSQARRFHHEVSKEAGFRFVYDCLMTYHTGTSKKQVSAAPVEADASLASVFVADGQMTDAEQRMGRAQLHKVLFREFTHWWSAFVAEAREDTEPGAPSASDRFSYHCARIISRKTGLRDDLIAPVVAAWLIEKANA
jgi:hypothetical protein